MRVSEALDIKIEDIRAKGRYRRIVEARGLLCLLCGKGTGSIYVFVG